MNRDQLSDIIKNEQFDEALKKRLRQIIDELAGTQKKFAKELGLNLQTVNNWLKRNSLPSAQNMRDICLKFSISPQWLFFGLGNMQTLYHQEFESLFDIWCSIWSFKGGFSAKELITTNTTVYRRRLEEKLEQKNEDSKSQVSNLVWSLFDEWCKHAEAWITETGNFELEIKDIDYRISREGNLIFLGPKKVIELKDLDRRKKASLKHFYEAKRSKQEMFQKEGEINTLLRLFEG